MRIVSRSNSFSLVALLVVAMVAAGCGGGGGGDGEAESRSPTTVFLTPSVLGANPFLGTRPFVEMIEPGTAVIVPFSRTFDTVDRYYQFDVSALSFIEYVLPQPLQVSAISKAGDRLGLLGITCEGLEDGIDCSSKPEAGVRAAAVEIDVLAASSRWIDVSGSADSTRPALGVSDVGDSPLFLVDDKGRQWAAIDEDGALVAQGEAAAVAAACGTGDGFVSVNPARTGEATTGVTALAWTVSDEGVQRLGKRSTFASSFDEKVVLKQLASTSCTDAGQPIIVGLDQTAVINGSGDTFTRLGNAPPGVGPFTVVGATDRVLYSLSAGGVVARLENRVWKRVELPPAGPPSTEPVVEGAPRPPPVDRLSRVGTDVLLITSDRSRPGTPRTFVQLVSS